MNLIELRDEINRIIVHACECEEPPEEVEVSLQIDKGTKSVYTKDIELHYDNNTQASGLVILGNI